MTEPLRFRRRPLELEAIRNTDLDAGTAIVRWIKEVSTDELDVELFDSGLLTIYSIDRPPMECERGDWMVLDRGRFVPWTDAAINDLAEPVRVSSRELPLLRVEETGRDEVTYTWALSSDPRIAHLDDSSAWVNPVEVH